MTVVVTTIDDLLSALIGADSEILVAGGKYTLPKSVIPSFFNKRIYGQGLVQFIGPFNISGCRNSVISNIAFRCPVGGYTEGELRSLDAIKIENSSDVCFTNCSIYGGADETVSVRASERCGFRSCVIGACFTTSRRHEMAMLIEADGFSLVGSILLGCRRRLPQLGGNRTTPNRYPHLVLGNLLECGHTMSLAVKGIDQPFEADIIDNVFYHHARTRCPEFAVADVPTAVASVFLSGNSVKRFSGVSDILEDRTSNGHYLGISQYPRHDLASIRLEEFTHLSNKVGQSHWDAWDHVIRSAFGQGRLYASDASLPSL